MKKIVLVLPSLHAGGMEKVMSDIANYLAQKTDVKVFLILLTKGEKFYFIDKDVILIEPSFITSSSFKNKLRILKYLRYQIREIKPYSILSFGSMYNSFVMLANLGLRNKVFLSDRSNPFRNSFKSLFKKNGYINDGLLHVIFKKVLYRFAYGIIVQTKYAKNVEQKLLKHKNIIVIPNPIRNLKSEKKNNTKEKIILNVGRFIKTKQQIELVKIFGKIKINSWKLVFLGDGAELETVKSKVKELAISDVVEFEGNVSNIGDFYAKSSIFAFTSTSEGFPNALAEAIIAPIASISFDCIAGPSDLIENEFNGDLIPVNDFNLYTKKLEELMLNEGLRKKYMENSKEVMKKFDFKEVMKKFDSVLTK